MLLRSAGRFLELLCESRQELAIAPRERLSLQYTTCTIANNTNEITTAVRHCARLRRSVKQQYFRNHILCCNTLRSQQNIAIRKIVCVQNLQEVHVLSMRRAERNSLCAGRCAKNIIKSRCIALLSRLADPPYDGVTIRTPACLRKVLDKLCAFTPREHRP
jgi:hypothetical protein